MIKTSLIDPIIKAALREDIGVKDITTAALFSEKLPTKADIQFQQKGVLCGLEIAERVFRLVDEDVRFLPVAQDGESIEKGREVAYIEGSARSILLAERTALNFISHLSGVATLTRQYAEKIKGTDAKLLDTRKTTPNLRVFEKYATAMGGATNHRMGLFDQAMIKDNHLRILRDRSLVELVGQVKSAVLKRTVIGLEVKNLQELKEALKSKADYILLDNMSVEIVKEAVSMRKKTGSRIELEVSGGINLDNILGYAKTGVERISVGALTHGAPSMDISLNIVH